RNRLRCGSWPASGAAARIKSRPCPRADCGYQQAANRGLCMTATLFTNANLFDGVGSELRGGAQVLVADGVIQAVSERAIAPPESAEVLDLGGRTLMPGLIDAHVHIWATDLDIVKLISRRSEYLAAFAYRSLHAMLNRGFTTVRDAGGTDVAYVQALQDGLAPGPRLLH